MAGARINQQWARMGAATRLDEIDRERAMILRSFPDLAKGGSVVSLAFDSLGRRRRKVSVAGRKRMSEGMRKYWAKRKATERK